MLDLAHPVLHLRPASYNPRAITPDALEKLKVSISSLGFCKPIIVTTTDLIVAGHQRTKAARALGMTTVPAWVIPAEKLIKDDEVLFNQLHNGTDTESANSPVWLPAVDESQLGVFTDVQPKDVRGDHRMSGAPLRAQISQLLARYGNWGGCVATLKGLVVSSPHYALGAAALGMPVRVWRIKDHEAEYANTTFRHQYGAFNYDHIKRDTFNQTLAQPFRLRKGRGLSASGKGSTLYLELVEPSLKPGDRLLDFGCGQADHVKRLQSKGVRAFGIEFFYRDGSRLDYRAIRAMIDAALANWARYGGFDIVLADAVLNSVDTLQAESDVLTCLHAMVKPGGIVYATGRERTSREKCWQQTQFSTRTGLRRQVEFLDGNGFSAYQRGAYWFFQKFHTVPEMNTLLNRHHFADVVVGTQDGGSYWRAICRKGPALPVEQVEGALRREFDLPWPEGNSVGRGEQAVAAWHAAQAIDAKTWPVAVQAVLGNLAPELQ